MQSLQFNKPLQIEPSYVLVFFLFSLLLNLLTVPDHFSMVSIYTTLESPVNRKFATQKGWFSKLNLNMWNPFLFLSQCCFVRLLLILFAQLLFLILISSYSSSFSSTTPHGTLNSTLFNSYWWLSYKHCSYRLYWCIFPPTSLKYFLA